MWGQACLSALPVFLVSASMMSMITTMMTTVMMKLMLLMMKMLLMVLMIGDDDPAGASPVYLAFGVPCQWMCDEKDALTRLAPDEIG